MDSRPLFAGSNMRLSKIHTISIAMASSIVFSMLFALIFRFPIPMGGMMGPFGDLRPFPGSMLEFFLSIGIAWLFYFFFGGFVFLILLGSIAGILVERYATEPLKNRMSMIAGSIAGLIPVAVLSTLDFIIGPW
jgi:hypothetical protein